MWHVFESRCSDEYINQYGALTYVGRCEDKASAVALAEDRYWDNVWDDYYISFAVHFETRYIVVFGDTHPFGGNWDEEYMPAAEFQGPHRINTFTLADMAMVHAVFTAELVSSVSDENQLLSRLRGK